MPDDKARAAHLRKFFATVTRHHHLAGGGVEVATDGSTIGAAALWDPPGRWKQSAREQLMMLPSFILGFGLRLALGRKLGATARADEVTPPRGTALVSRGDRQ